MQRIPLWRNAFQVIEVKACSTRMRELGLETDALPALIEIVSGGRRERSALSGWGAENLAAVEAAD